MSAGDFVFEEGQHIECGFFHASIVKRWRDESGRKFYTYLCDRCQCENQKAEHLIEKGSGCPVCSNRKVVKGVNDITTTDPWMVSYFKGGIEEASQYTSNCGKKFIAKCPFCGRIRDKPISPNDIFVHRGMACVCKDGISIPNKFIYGLMEQAKENGNIADFQREYYVVDMTGVRRFFDMYFCDNNDNKYLVEMDGGYNHGDVIKKHRLKNNQFVFVPAKYYYIDMIKNDLGEELNCSVIRIDCYKSEFDYIKHNILNSALSKVINMKDIDWDRILELCYGNLIRDVCEYRCKHPECFSPEVSKLFGLSRSTVTAYWRIGHELGWCHYVVEEERHRSNIRSRPKTTDTPVVVFDTLNGKEYRFNTIVAFIENTKDIFGEQLTRKCFANLCKKHNNEFTYLNRYKITKCKSKKEELNWQ